jgi:endothelin-converting enzyme
MSLDAADKLTPPLHLASILKSLSPKGVSNDRIIVASPSYMTNLTVILTETSTSTLQHYLGWKLTQAYYSRVEAEELKPYTRFVNELQGKDPDSTPERWRTCVKYVDGGLGWILSRFFVEKAFSEKAKEFGDQIVSDIKDTFIEKLKVTEWMDKKVIDLAIEKVHKIVQKIGYPTKVYRDILIPSKLSILMTNRAQTSWIRHLSKTTTAQSTSQQRPISKILSPSTDSK